MILVVKRKCPDTNRTLRTMIDIEEVISANEDVLHEIEGYTEEDEPIFKEGGDCSNICTVVFRNSHVLRVPDYNLALLTRILELRTQQFHDNSAYEEIDLGSDASATSYDHDDEDEDDDGED